MVEENELILPIQMNHGMDFTTGYHCTIHLLLFSLNVKTMEKKLEIRRLINYLVVFHRVEERLVF